MGCLAATRSRITPTCSAGYDAMVLASPIAQYNYFGAMGENHGLDKGIYA